MTRISYEPEEYRLRVEGHAGSAPSGQDLICSALTILGWTLISAAEAFNMHLHLDDMEGLMDIRCYPDEKDEEKCRFLFDTFAAGYEMLADKFPENVQIGGYYGDDE